MRATTLINSGISWITRKVSNWIHIDILGFVAEDGTNVDNWTMEEIIAVVAEFVQHYNSMAEPLGEENAN